MAPGGGDREVRRGALRGDAGGRTGRLSDPDGADKRPDITQRAMPAGSHLPPPWPTSAWHFHQ